MPGLCILKVLEKKLFAFLVAVETCKDRVVAWQTADTHHLLLTFVLYRFQIFTLPIR